MKLLSLIIGMLFCFTANAQLYRGLFYGPMFSSTQSGTVSNIFLATNLVTAAPWLTMNTGIILGRTTASAGAIEAISIGSGLTLAAGTLSSSASSALNTITADAASSSINNGNFTNAFNWQLTGATRNAFRFGESAASTGGGAGNQYILTAENLVGSTANPFGVFNQGTNIMTVWHATGQLLMGPAGGNPDLIYPLYSFRLNQTYGFDLNAGSSALVAIRNGVESMRWDSAGFKTGAGSVGSPVGSFTTATSSGYYSPFAGTIGFSGGGVLGAWITNSVFHSTNHWINLVPYTWPTAQGGASTVLQNDGAGVLTWAAASSGASFSALTAATGDNAIQNGAFNQLWRFTDPGTGEINLELTGTNSTASGLLYVRGQMTHATAVQTRFTESLASTGGSGAQDLVRIDTVASSTATPLALYSRATRVLEVGYNANQLWAMTALSASVPQYSFLGLKTGGMQFDGSSVYLQYDNIRSISVNGSGVTTATASTYSVLDNNGYVVTDGAGSAFRFSTGNSANYGIELTRRVKTTTSGSLNLTGTIANSNSDGPFSVQSNDGASGGVTYNLPAATVGNSYVFTVMDTDGITIDAAGTDTIQINATVTSGGGTLASATVGNTCTLVCVTAGKWIVTSYVGTIAVTWTTT